MKHFYYYLLISILFASVAYRGAICCMLASIQPCMSCIMRSVPYMDAICETLKCLLDVVLRIRGWVGLPTGRDGMI